MILSLIHHPGQASPIAALLDGVPVQGHALLQDRIVLDDPDGLDAQSVVAERRHGTAMASLIIHGDRQLAEPALQRRIYLRPVLYAPGGGQSEQVAADRLVLDTIYRAVLRMKEGDEEGEPTAPDVFIVNLSLGDPKRPFAGSISPWARLLDYLADRFGLLFVVSAGNVLDPLVLSGFNGFTDFDDASPEQREDAILDGTRRRSSNAQLAIPCRGTQPDYRRRMARRRRYGSAHQSSLLIAALPRVWPQRFLRDGPRT